MTSKAKEQIVSAIEKTDDQAMKTVLLLLLGVFEEIGEKIDSALKNERTLRNIVLNNHEPVHHKHHEWVSEQMARDTEIDLVLAWAKRKMQDEHANRESGRKIRDGVITKLAELSLAGGLGWFIGRLFN